jgi:serine/threonine-protein kinase
MSPEQVKGKPVDGRSDIFSLGVVLYELMTGEKPFPGQNITTVIYKIINEEPIPPRSLDSSIHPGLSAVISKALAKNPDERYQSCGELLNALKNYHEMMSPDATVRMAPVTSSNAPGGIRQANQPPRIAALPASAPSREADLSPQFILPVPVEESRKRPGGLLLSFILLGIIGYSGYRVYPPLVDLWKLAREPREIQATPAQGESTPAATDSDTSNVKPDAPSSVLPQSAVPVSTPAVPTAIAPAPVERVTPRATSQPLAEPVGAAKTPEAAPAAASTADKSIAAQKPVTPPAPSPAHLLESRLRKELTGQPFFDKLKIQTTGNALTLSGALTLAEHRELLQHLRTVPAGVRVIDDTEITESPIATPAPTSAGWIWVRSAPPGASIVVDGAETGMRTPARLELQAGEHEIRLVHQGFATSQRNVMVSQGQTMQFTETLATE